MDVLSTIARGNGLDSSLGFKLKAPMATESSSSHGVLDLFRYPEIRKRTILLICAW